MAFKKATTTEALVLTPIRRETVQIDIQGTAPLIVHAWSAKSRQMMLDGMQGKKSVKTIRDPLADFQESQYRLFDGGHGFPTLAFKAATVGAARYFSGITMTQLRQNMHFISDEIETGLTRLHVDEPIMREDTVRVGMGKADLRYRAEYRRWGATLTIAYLPSVISLDSIVALVEAGGMGGVGEWRPERDGAFGTYEVTGQ